MSDRSPEVALTGFLQTMWEIQAERVQMARREVAFSELARGVASMGPVLDFAGALRRSSGPVRVIAEVKRASPSKGPLFPGAKAGDLAARYEQAGASALSILTEERYFSGHLDDLQEAKARVGLPVMRKDFLIDPYQVLEARVCGADACLLIAAMLGPSLLAEMCAVALEYGIHTLIEVHGEEDLAWAVEAVAKNRSRRPEWLPVVGINARNLATLTVDKEQVLRLGAALPEDVVKVAESGIRDAGDARRALEAGFDAILVGEALVTAVDPGKALRELIGAPR
ncbi:indole-3-glycerol-phosphate synthase TrpC [Heliobacterium gestii]|uniref:indole-3-glycerol-phosphate synthase n=1 Tax=Heliomicrobium gestii TaxID=2699 RepID=A0A845L7Z2_HELGE|nr:indole-3-glycerol phosphate synthase TrpC [Heliomicrobium gestii]MBM7865446.1 indole-3-glycerol phosphate synthase [Heliomicrobium gestii]MZP41701.1 indole-3-glycerol-phosphate synthase TrpC [Heliomicrobium gestii]